MGLNPRQKEAVEYLDGPLLVQAGPGTGKTQLLSEKVAYILKNTDTNPENILCLTFTDTGASNMRERLKSIIGKDGAKVNIGTYHAFGQDILAQYKNYSIEYSRKLDNAIDEVTQFKIISDIQAALPGTDILRGDNVKDIINVISEAKSAQLSAEDLKKVAEMNIGDSMVLGETISPLLLNVVPKKYQESLDNAYFPIYELINKYQDIQPIVPSVERSIARLARELNIAINEANASQNIKPLTAWRNNYFDKDERGNYRLKDYVANKKLLSLSNVMKLYDDYLKKNGLFDFDDMIEEAVKVLKDDVGFKMTLQERYQFILLDEFQDTNPSQFAIVKQLTDYEKPMIMAVGDDDQAIYEFQGALSSNLDDYQKYYGAKVVELVENYRSTQEILDYSTNIIKQADDRFKPDKALVAHKPSPKHSQIYRFEFVSSDAEYGFIADKIDELILKGVPQREIAIISHKSKYFEPLLNYLKAHDKIKIAYEKRDNLFDDTKIHEILTIAKYVDEIASEKKTSVQLMEIMLYSFFNLPVVEVVKIINQARAERKNTLELLFNSDNEKIKNVAKFIYDLVAKSYVEPLNIMFNYIMGQEELNGYTSPFLDYYIKFDNDASEYETFRFYENLAFLKGRLKNHFGERDEVLKLHDLISMISDYELAEIPLNTKSPYRDADDAVQVLTAHKAKGLEFKYVFIVSADNAAWGKKKGNNSFLTLPKNLQQIRHTGITDSERLRVLYVAMTRAEQTLYITNSLMDFTGKKQERLDYLHEYVDGDKIVSEFLPCREIKQVTSEERKEKRLLDVKNWVVRRTLEAPDMRAYYKDKMQIFSMSATALTTFIDIIYGGPETFYRRYVLGLSEPGSESQAFGTLMHATFEKVTNDGLSDEEAVKYFLEELNHADIASEVKTALSEKGATNIMATLDKFGEVIRHGKAELDFYTDKIAVNGVPISGKIDHIMVDDDKKTIEIYDYKTGSFHKEKWNSHPTLYMQMLQLIFYKMLLNNSPRYRKYKVTKGHILYVTKDKNDDEVHEKVYEYDEKDEAVFKEILETVYHYATSLEFLDDSELFLSPDKGRNMKNVRDFITFMLAKYRQK